MLSNRKTIIRLVITAAAMGVLIATAFLTSTKPILNIADAKTGVVLYSCPVTVGEEFSIEFIHSVNKSPVEDFYRIEEDGIHVFKTRYYGFGAGVQTELLDGQILTYEDNGSSMVISGFDVKMDDLQYIVGTVSDHILRIGGNEISLRDTCGRNTRIKIYVV